MHMNIQISGCHKKVRGNQVFHTCHQSQFIDEPKVWNQQLWRCQSKKILSVLQTHQCPIICDDLNTLWWNRFQSRFLHDLEHLLTEADTRMQPKIRWLMDLRVNYVTNQSWKEDASGLKINPSTAGITFVPSVQKSFEKMTFWWLKITNLIVSIALNGCTLEPVNKIDEKRKWKERKKILQPNNLQFQVI